MKGMGVGLGPLPQEVTLETRAEGLGPTEISRKGTPGGEHSKRQSPRGGNQLNRKAARKARRWRARGRGLLGFISRARPQNWRGTL